MKSLLLLERLHVENANAISGMTWGFPAITHFLGLTHLLSRYVKQEHGQELGGCGVICHWHQVKAHQPGGVGEYVFSLSRNPLVIKGSEAVTAPFNEEGKMHMEVSLLIECDFRPRKLNFNSGNPDEDARRFARQIRDKLLTLRLAGGSMRDARVSFESLPESSDELKRWTRRKLLKLLPGFALIDRSELLSQHLRQLRKEQPETGMLDAWLDLAAIKYQAVPEADTMETANEQTAATWKLMPKPAEGWLVPIMTGYQAISPLYMPGEVAHSRSSSVPFRFVESAYGMGQWLSPHRARNLDQLIWRYQQHGTGYFCTNDYLQETGTQ